MVGKEVIQDGDYIDLLKLSEKYDEMQQKLGLQKRSVQNQNLKARLINAFGKPNRLLSKF